MLVTRDFNLKQISGEYFNLKRTNKCCMERKKVRSGSNEMIIVHSNVSNQMISPFNYINIYIRSYININIKMK